MVGSRDEPHVFQSLEAAQARLAELLAERLSPAALEHWPRRLRILQFVPPEGVRQTDLAARALITKQALGEHLDALCASGVLVREPDPEDGRAWLVRLTPAGEAVVADFGRALEEVEAVVARQVGTGRWATVLEVLAQLAR
jgi:DNA-binding MarR family transcriptional regulator